MTTQLLRMQNPGCWPCSGHRGPLLGSARLGGSRLGCVWHHLQACAWLYWSRNFGKTVLLQAHQDPSQLRWFSGSYVPLPFPLEARHPVKASLPIQALEPVATCSGTPVPGTPSSDTKRREEHPVSHIFVEHGMHKKM